MTARPDSRVQVYWTRTVRPDSYIGRRLFTKSFSYFQDHPRLEDRLAASKSHSYLQENVGKALSDAFSALALAQPADGVDFLATYLKQYTMTEKLQKQREDAAKEREQLRQKIAEELGVKAAKEGELRKAEEAKQAGRGREGYGEGTSLDRRFCLSTGLSTGAFERGSLVLHALPGCGDHTNLST